MVVLSSEVARVSGEEGGVVVFQSGCFYIWESSGAGLMKLINARALMLHYQEISDYGLGVFFFRFGLLYSLLCVKTVVLRDPPTSRVWESREDNICTLVSIDLKIEPGNSL